MLRHSPGPSGGRQSRTKWPALASSAARTASAARNSSTLTELVPSGTVVTISVRYSMGFSFRSPGFSRFCHRLLRDLSEHRLIFPLRVVIAGIALGIVIVFALFYYTTTTTTPAMAANNSDAENMTDPSASSIPDFLWYENSAYGVKM